MVSVVAPVHRNADTLWPVHRGICAALEPLGQFEVIYVNDACPAGSEGVLAEIAAADARARVLHLPGNIGQHRAILRGFGQARGDVVVSIDADLQDPPEALPALLGRLSEGYDIVFYGRRGRYASVLRYLSSYGYKRVQHWLVGVPLDAGSYVVLRRRVVDEVLAMPAGPQTIVAMIGVVGGRMVSVPGVRPPRRVGRSAYSFWMRLSLAVGSLWWALRARLGRRGRRVPPEPDVGDQ